MTTTSGTGRFRLFATLAGDLRAASRMSRGVGSALSGPRLWLGIFSPRFIPNLLCRLAYFFYSIHLGPIGKLFALLNFFLFGIEIAVRCPIGPGLFLPHTQGTVIGAYRIGVNVTIFQGVTLGAREVNFAYGPSERPTIEDNVSIGAGAKVIGGLTVGEGARIGANAVVVRSIPAGATAVGVPARLLGIESEDADAVV